MTTCAMLRRALCMDPSDRLQWAAIGRLAARPMRLAAPAGLAVCLLIASPISSAALNPRTLISQYTSDHWQTRDGLPQASVSAFAQTSDGYMWLATEEGLVRFDGVHFTVFDTTNSALVDNYISGLSAGRDGSLWVRTAETLYRYRAGKLQPLCAGRSIGLDATPILEDQSGAIWSGDAGGVMVYAPNGQCSHHASRSGRRGSHCDRAARAPRRQHPDRDDPRSQAISWRRDYRHGETRTTRPPRSAHSS